MITANFSAYDTYKTDSLYQWDLNQVLTVTGLNLTAAPEVHFSNSNTDRAIVRQATMVNHVVSVGIPNSLLQDPLTIKAHIGIYEGSTFKVVEEVLIPVIARKRPLDYQIEATDEEVYSFKRLENLLGNKADAATINARVDNIVAGVGSDVELVDVRYGADGVTYASAGEAVRTQTKVLGERVSAFNDKALSPNIFNEKSDLNTTGAYLFYNGTEAAVGSDYSYSYPIPVMTGETYISKRFDASFGSDSHYIIAYDANGDYHSFIVCEKVTSNGVDCNLFTVPAGVHFIRVNYMANRNFMFVRGSEYPAEFIEYYDVRTEHEALVQMKAPFYGKVMVNFGDSIFGLVSAPNDVSTYLENIIGGTVHNAGFGGCRMGKHTNASYDAFSMYRLAEAIASRNWSLQENALEDTSLPAYFADRVNTLKTLDFKNVDVITIAYGTNDFADGLQPGEFVEAGSDRFNYFTTALKYSIETIQTAFPQLKIFVLTPCWRCWVENGEVVADGNTKEVESWAAPNGKTKLTDFVAACYEAANEYQLPVIDNYNIGVNKFNHASYLTDTTHPNEAGRKRIAQNIAKCIW